MKSIIIRIYKTLVEEIFSQASTIWQFLNVILSIFRWERRMLFLFVTFPQIINLLMLYDLITSLSFILSISRLLVSLIYSCSKLLVGVSSILYIQGMSRYTPLLQWFISYLLDKNATTYFTNNSCSETI